MGFNGLYHANDYRFRLDFLGLGIVIKIEDVQIKSVITWSDGQQTIIRNQAEIDMIQWCLWDVEEVL